MVEFLLRTDLGIHIAEIIYTGTLFAPELLDAEVLAVLRRETQRGVLPVHRAIEAIDDLTQIDVQRLSHRELLRDAWDYRHNVSAYDALYVAVAKQRKATILTADGPLTRSPIKGILVHNIAAS